MLDVYAYVLYGLPDLSMCLDTFHFKFIYAVFPFSHNEMVSFVNLVGGMF